MLAAPCCIGTPYSVQPKHRSDGTTAGWGDHDAVGLKASVVASEE